MCLALCWKVAGSKTKSQPPQHFSSGVCEAGNKGALTTKYRLSAQVTYLQLEATQESPRELGSPHVVFVGARPVSENSKRWLNQSRGWFLFPMKLRLAARGAVVMPFGSREAPPCLLQPSLRAVPPIPDTLHTQGRREMDCEGVCVKSLLGIHP